MTVIPKRVCAKCKRPRSVMAFSRDKKQPGGRSTVCRACLSAQKAARRLVRL